ncbi:MAG: TIGR03032 family protein [Parasphingorhabdus sp.]|uniref:TIGR03032 family protein n=3 Tax=Parasphingorhabdus sp. TaxID=2709688 RepID=UPI0032636726
MTKKKPEAAAEAETATPENTNKPTEAQPNAQPEAGKIDINFSHGLAGFLASNAISIGFTSYQTGRLYLVGAGPDGKLALHEAQYPQAMGVAGDQERLYLGTLTQIVRMENVLGPDQLANGAHDKVYVPRNMQTTGNIDIHELGIRENGRMVFVNTRYSCLCEPSVKHSFKPIWKPEFITKLAPEDRCHLNGLAMVDNEPKYVSAVCKSDVVDGWRDRRHDGGVIIDIETNAIMADGLSMPHSPRFHAEKLWVLNSGTGELGWLHPSDGAFTPVAFFPGFLRGLAFHNDHAFVTLSKPRHGRFEGLALDDKLKEKDADAWCGIQIVSLSSGDVAQWLRFDGAITELFDICVLPGVKNPITLGPQSQEIRDFITMEALQ